MKLEIEQIEFVKEIIKDLKVINKTIPIIVEGKRDRLALMSLGVKGKIIQLHRGQNIYEFCEDILKRYEKVILLIDWDKRGQHIYQKVSHLLKGHFEEYSLFRNSLMKVLGKEIKEVEEIPRIFQEDELFK